MAAPFVFDRRFRFAVGPEHLWDVLAETGDYGRWWPWLEDFEADGLHDGASARFSVRSPLPYRLRVALDLERVVPCALVEARVGGDVEGPARLELTPAANEATEARLSWRLEVRRPLLLAVERVARPAMVWGHDTVVARGVRSFRERALATTLH